MYWYLQHTKKPTEGFWHLQAVTSKPDVAFDKETIENFRKQGLLYKVETWDERCENMLEVDNIITED